MPWNQYLLLLVGGYWFLHFVHLLRFRAQRLSGQRLLIEAVTAGGLAGLAALAATRLAMTTSLGMGFALEWKKLFPQSLSGTIAAGLLLLAGVGVVLRRVWPPTESKNRALAVLGTRYEQMLFRSVQEQSLPGEEATALRKAILDHSILYRFVDVEMASLIDEDSADEIADRLLERRQAARASTPSTPAIP